MKQAINFSSLATAMDQYLQGSAPAELKFISPENKTVSRLPVRWAQWVLVQLQEQPLLIRAQVTEVLLNTWRARRLELTAQQQYAAFKVALRQPWQGWQERLLNFHWQKQLQVQMPVFNVNHDLKIPLNEEKTKRHQLVSGEHFTQGALVGTSFSHYPYSGVQDNQIPQPVLDAGFSASVLDEEGQHRGFVMALGDGAGGHFGDPAQDKRIAHTVYFAAKKAARLLAAIKDPEVIAKDYIALVEHIAESMLGRSDQISESTTLVALRGFWKPGQTTIEVAGIGVGDSMLLYWHPLTQQLIPLIPAQRWESRHGQQATALLPKAYQRQEILLIRQTLPTDGVFLACSDGGYEGFSLETKRQQDEKEGFVQTIIPNAKAWIEVLAGYQLSQPVTDLLQSLWVSALNQQEQKRQSLQREMETIVNEREQVLKTLQSREQEAQTSPDGIQALKRRPSYQMLCQTATMADSKLRQAEIGDDVLWLAIATPRLLSLKEEKEEKYPINEQKKSLANQTDIATAEKKLATLQEQLADLRRQQSREEKDLTEKQLQQPLAVSEALNKKIDEKRAEIVEQKQLINHLMKCPNPLFELLEQTRGFECHTEQEQKKFETKLLDQLKDLWRAHGHSKTAWLESYNHYQEAAWMLALQGKCYVMTALLLQEMSEAALLGVDNLQQNILHLLAGQRFLSNPHGLENLLRLLQKRGVLHSLLWQKDQYHKYPLQRAIHKAVNTQQTHLLKLLLEIENEEIIEGIHSNQSSLLAMSDEEGNTLLHMAIQGHARSGAGLPIIIELLRDIYECPLRLSNRAGQTAVDWAMALSLSKHPLWGQTVLNHLRHAEQRYRKRLEKWGFIPLEQSQSQEDNKKTKKPEKMASDPFWHEELAFAFAYQTCVHESKQPEKFQSLYARYSHFYEPILTNDHRQAQALLIRIGEQWRTDKEFVDKALKEILSKRLGGLSSSEKAEAEFYEIIYKRTQDVNRYRQLMLSTARGIRFYEKNLSAAPKPLETHQRYLQGASEVRIQLHQAFLQAKQLLMSDNPTVHTFDHYQELLSLFGEVDKRAELISYFQWAVVPIERQMSLLSVLFKRSWTRLVLHDCGVLTALLETPYLSGDKPITTVWEALFYQNQNLQTLHIIGDCTLQPEHIALLAKQCPQLQSLTLENISLTAIHSPGYLLSSSLHFPQLQSLHLRQCKTLVKIDCQTPQLTQLQIEECKSFTTLECDAPQLLSIGSYGSPHWRNLKTQQAALRPLAQVLATLTRRSPGPRPSIYLAARAGELAVVRWLVDQRLEINHQDEKQQTALHAAVETGQCAVVNYLVGLPGIHLDARDQRQRTPLHLAVAQLYREVVACLCLAGANPHWQDDQKLTPLDYCRTQRQQDGVDLSLLSDIESHLMMRVNQQSSQSESSIQDLEITGSMMTSDYLQRHLAVLEDRLNYLTPLQNQSLFAHRGREINRLRQEVNRIRIKLDSSDSLPLTNQSKLN